YMSVAPPKGAAMEKVHPRQSMFLTYLDKLHYTMYFIFLPHVFDEKAVCVFFTPKIRRKDVFNARFSDIKNVPPSDFFLSFLTVTLP
ncbi:MAG: hypothetical protein II688_06280, partial [Lachnospiraceae bacterium]|nr:hypothetical protein [Lachnospiraceae bacterium]